MIRSLIVDARNLVARLRSAPAESKKRFFTISVGVLLLYFVLAASWYQQGRLDGLAEPIEALQRVAPAAAGEIRKACEADWLTPDCSLFWLIREEAK